MGSDSGRITGIEFMFSVLGLIVGGILLLSCCDGGHVIWP